MPLAEVSPIFIQSLGINSKFLDHPLDVVGRDNFRIAARPCLAAAQLSWSDYCDRLHHRVPNPVFFGDLIQHNSSPGWLPKRYVQLRHPNAQKS